MFTFERFTSMRVIVFLLIATGSYRVLALGDGGLRFNNLSVSPFVNLEYSYDSNVDFDKSENKDTIFRINPGVDLTYTGNDWGLTGNGWFSYDMYSKYDILNALRYGETLGFYRESASGWKFTLGESYLKSNQNDSMAEGGKGLWRDRDELSLNSSLSCSLSEKTSISLTGMYTSLNYLKAPQYKPLYGWDEWSLGLEFAYKITEKSNLLLDGGYQGYVSDGAANGVSSQSTGYSLMTGFGSSATKKITYRALAGLSMFDYAGGDQLVGWTYSLDSSWTINRKLALTVAGSSYFQPSEREQNQALQVYALSTGLTYRTTPKLTTRFDFAFRQEQNQYVTQAAPTAGSVTEDRLEARARADYKLMRYVTVYAMLECQKQMSDDAAYAFDRYRGTLGLNLRY